ncbi:MAG TPA: lysine biosynthesis protein LysX [Thermomicrobiales bacterium]|nr:lysine biosynthesis protein LysX [Thermomicrobiales bacterium]
MAVAIKDYTHGGGQQIRVGMLVSHLREEEKSILAAARRRGISLQVLQDRRLVLDLTGPNPPAVDVVLDRCMAHTRGGYALRAFERWGIPTINSSSAAATCDDKIEMTAALSAAGVPTLQTAVAFSVDGALEAAEELGYPVVLKPVGGSWGRLLAKANSESSLRTILEQKQQLGSHHHGVFYLQEYVEKPGRDIRVLVVGSDVIAASYRSAGHWITNVARGATSTRCEVTPEIAGIAIDATRAVGATLAGIDLVETPDGLKVIEVNSGVEFKGLRTTTDLSIPDVILDHALSSVVLRKWEVVA